MSKRQSNTLLNYFQSPKVNKTNGDKESTSAGVIGKKEEQQSNANSDEEETITLKKRNRSQILADSSDSETSDSDKRSIKKAKAPSSDGSESENCTPNKRKTPAPKKQSATRDDSRSNRKSLGDFAFKNKDPSNKTDIVTVKTEFKDIKDPSNKTDLVTVKTEFKDIHSSWVHNGLDFLKPDKIMDAKRNRPSDPEYDRRTLYVPENYLKGLTPAMRQWWELKRQYMDSVLFFKVGKFYELYHMDAVVGVAELGFSYMKGEFAHSGFPESAYGKMASALIEKGYKVARVEQTETPEMMDIRCKSMNKPTKFDKVVTREICQVSAKATTVYTAQLSEPPNELPHYMYAICVKPNLTGSVRIGVCFIETSIGTFHLSEFEDDKYLSILLAVIAEYPAALILTERNTTRQLSEILNTHFRDVRKETLSSKNQFYPASVTLEKLVKACYFKNKEGKFTWPEFFKTVADDCLPKKGYELVLSSLGACLWYLTNSKLDIQVFSMGQFVWYDPLNMVLKRKKPDIDYLILDSATMHNLNLLGGKGSLQGILDHCGTAFGKRLLHRWICRPSCNILKIKERQKAVTQLLNHSNALKNAQALFKNLPDLERQMTKIHNYGNKFISANHPDGRAIFYEEAVYSKLKIKDFIVTIKGFEKFQAVPDIFKDCKEGLLKKITQFSPDGVYIDLSKILIRIKSSFDFEEAEKQSKIIPKRGAIPSFDRVEIEIDNIKAKLDKYLKEQSKFFGCQLSYFGTEKKRFQLDVPTNKADRATNEYQFEGAKKGSSGTKRFSTPRTRELLAAMIKAETERAKVLLDLNRGIFETFSESHEEFSQVVNCLSILDVLCSLAEYARTYSQDICVPEILPFTDKPQTIITNGRHPCVSNVDNFVPNDTKLGTENQPSLLILTGPNMGGKSTLMRQVAVISIMAQLGSCVPASDCQLNLIDRIFTRIGAQDDIVHGQSTFHVELSEASTILQHGSKDSLVLIDELGRGTSTHDGTAIATAYVKQLTTIGCRTMFSTHYHSLVDHFVDRNDIQLGHMACMVEKHKDDPTQESVTFLYKLAEGRCPKSYGFDVATLAGLERSIVSKAREVAKILEDETKCRDIVRAIFAEGNLSDIEKLLECVVLNE